MSEVNATIIYEDRPAQTVEAWAEGDALWLSLADVANTTGWELKPEGVCRDELCVPIPAGRSDEFLHKEGNVDWLNLSEFARYIEQPLAVDAKHAVWSFGTRPEERENRLTGSIAPDFTLADMEGKKYSLSDFRGRKVLLALWATW
jgi:hypothetical protein